MKFIHKIMGAVVSIAVITCSIFSCVAVARDGVVTASALNVRSNPSYEASVIDVLKENTMVNAYDCEQCSWYIINYNDGYAYVVSDYIKLSSADNISPEKVYYDEVIYGKTTVDSLNVRNGATFDCTIVNKVPTGTKYIIYGEENGFYIVQEDEIERYVYKQYLDIISEEEYNYKPTGAIAVVEEAKKYIGTPYRYGGSSPKGFDCSGFTSYIYKKYGVTLNRTAAGQASNGVRVSKSELVCGDLVFFNTYGNGIGHVGIYIGDGEMIHAPYSGRTVCIESINTGYYASRYVGATRIFQD